MLALLKNTFYNIGILPRSDILAIVPLALRDDSVATGFEFKSQSPIPNSQFPIPNSQFPIPSFQFPINTFEIQFRQK